MKLLTLSDYGWSLASTLLLAQENAANPSADNGTAIVVAMVAGMAVITAVVVGGVLYLDRKRTAAMQSSVQTIGGTFRAKPTTEETQLIAATKWAAGRGRGMRNIIELPATDGARLTLLHFWVHSGKSGSEQTATHIHSPGLNLPGFELRPETTSMKLASAFGAQDIDLGASPAFSRAFRLRGDDETAIRRLFTPAVVQYCEKHPDLRIYGSGNSVVFFRQHHRVKPDNLPTFAAEARAVAALFLGSNTTQRAS